MTDIIINNTSNDYFDVFQTDLFTGSTGGKMNWLELDDRSKIKQEEEEEETDDWNWRYNKDPTRW